MPASDVLAIVKLRLGLDDSHDALIDSYVQEIGQRILHYCNLAEIPAELGHVWASMVIDVLRTELAHLPEIAQTAVPGEVTVGDTTSKPGVTPAKVKSVVDTVVLNYRADLNRYRKLRW